MLLYNTFFVQNSAKSGGGTKENFYFESECIMIIINRLILKEKQ